MQFFGTGRLLASQLTGLFAILLSSCAALTPEDIDTSERERRALYAERSEHLQAAPVWSMEGRLAVSDGEDGGSGKLQWREQPGHVELDFRGALGRGAWRLQISPGLAILSLGSGESWTAQDVSELIRAHVGWNIPVDSLGWWVRGLEAPGHSARRVLDAEGQVTTLVQNGWIVEYDRYRPYSGMSLPTRLEARNGDRMVKLIMRDWSFEKHPGHGP